MPATLRTVLFSDAVPIRRIGMVSEHPLVLRVETRSPDAVTTEARVNGLPATVSSVSGREVLVAVPPQLEDEVVRSVELFTTELVGTGPNRVSLELGRSIGLVSGVTKLLQQFVKLLLTTPGTDAFHRTYGGGLRQVLTGLSFDPRRLTPVTDAITRAVARTTAQIVSSQVSVRNLPDTERLRRAELVDLSFDHVTAVLSPKVAVEAVSGATAATMVTP